MPYIKMLENAIKGAEIEYSQRSKLTPWLLCRQGPFLLTGIIFNHSTDKYGMKLFIHSRTSTVAPLNFGIG